ncbi:exo-alpha-sialidase [Arthrobacter sp. zg-Y40]|uniref:WD40/YVTN/BNR-like repeat-containing protein n=1 Tax=Arthrobacter sp. zg-Y40 TaxID=2886939 RepID=UPI001D13402A|nr:exo-alpha-sialidase [Arthrobacter sp. zg-Y40]MCC3278637.1 exo-alpha-sialidase [Arthrobacter sp. zg-Y40]
MDDVPSNLPFNAGSAESSPGPSGASGSSPGPSSTVLAIGTRKGLWLATSSDRVTWELRGPEFAMTEVPSLAFDARSGTPRLLAGVRSEWWGPNVAVSEDLGHTWQEPQEQAIAFPEDTGATLERIWQLRPDTAGRPGVVWAGCEPISVFRSEDGGRHFELVRGLWDHPHRPQWGAGYGGPAAHTVLPSPVDDSVHVAISSGGVYRSDDRGDSWDAFNSGIIANFMPQEYPEFGQCVHKVARDAGNPERLYAQNHGGVYRSDDAGDQWISIADGLPADFGFVMLAHPSRPDTVWTIPLGSAGERNPPQGRPAVYRSTNAGEDWERFDAGLPAYDFNAVLRDAADVDTADPAGIYFGTRGGEVYASADEGETFNLVAANLPDVLCVRAVRT